MANVELSTLPKQQHDELCCTYATLLLNDAKISEEHLKKIIEASGNKVEAQWLKLFAKALKDLDVSTLFSSSAAPSAPVGSSSAPAAKVEAKKVAEKPKEAPKEEPKEEDMDMGDLFAF